MFQTFNPVYQLYALGRFLIGTSTGGFFTNMFVICELPFIPTLKQFNNNSWILVIIKLTNCFLPRISKKSLCNRILFWHTMYVRFLIFVHTNHSWDWGNPPLFLNVPKVKGMLRTIVFQIMLNTTFHLRKIHFLSQSTTWWQVVFGRFSIGDIIRYGNRTKTKSLKWLFLSSHHFHSFSW